MAFICIILMFMIDWIMALITVGIIAILYFFVVYRKPGMQRARQPYAAGCILGLSSFLLLSFHAPKLKAK